MPFSNESCSCKGGRGRTDGKEETLEEEEEEEEEDGDGGG